MPRGEAFNYLNVGKFLERGILSTDMLLIKLKELDNDFLHKVDVPALRYLLYSLSGYELYLKTHRGNFQADLVVDQIIFNESFPHSISYCLKQLHKYFERLESESIPAHYKEVEFLIGRSVNNVKYSAIKTIETDELIQMLKQTRTEFFEIANAINKYYFGNS